MALGLSIAVSKQTLGEQGHIPLNTGLSSLCSSWRAPPLGTARDIASGNWQFSSYGPLRGTWRVGSFTRYLLRQVKKAVETGRHLSLWELCEGNLDGELLYCGLWTICKRRLWKQAFLSIRTPSGILKGPPLPRTLRNG